MASDEVLNYIWLRSLVLATSAIFESLDVPRVALWIYDLLEMLFVSVLFTQFFILICKNIRIDWKLSNTNHKLFREYMEFGSLWAFSAANVKSPLGEIGSDLISTTWEAGWKFKHVDSFTHQSREAKGKAGWESVLTEPETKYITSRRKPLESCFVPLLWYQSESEASQIF